MGTWSSGQPFRLISAFSCHASAGDDKHKIAEAEAQGKIKQPFADLTGRKCRLVSHQNDGQNDQRQDDAENHADKAPEEDHLDGVEV